MKKNIAIAVLAVIALVEGGVLVSRRLFHRTMSMQQPTVSASPSPMGSPPPRGMMVSKGMKLADTPLAQNTYKIAPGDLSDDAKKAMVGFDISSQKMADGSLDVKLTPKDSDDQKQEYIVKTGESLYFVELTPVDDKPDQDKDTNYRDDYGIIVDQNGIVQ